MTDNLVTPGRSCVRATQTASLVAMADAFCDRCRERVAIPPVGETGIKHGQ